MDYLERAEGAKTAEDLARIQGQVQTLYDVARYVFKALDMDEERVSRLLIEGIMGKEYIPPTEEETENAG